MSEGSGHCSDEISKMIMSISCYVMLYMVPFWNEVLRFYKYKNFLAKFQRSISAYIIVGSNATIVFV